MDQPTEPKAPRIPQVGDVVMLMVGEGNQWNRTYDRLDHVDVLRPALVTHVWNGQCVNLQVFWDGINDRARRAAIGAAHDDDISWVTSSTHGYELRQWRWPVR